MEITKAPTGYWFEFDEISKKVVLACPKAVADNEKDFPKLPGMQRIRDNKPGTRYWTVFFTIPEEAAN